MIDVVRDTLVNLGLKEALCSEMFDFRSERERRKPGLRDGLSVIGTGRSESKDMKLGTGLSKERGFPSTKLCECGMIFGMDKPFQLFRQRSSWEK